MSKPYTLPEISEFSEEILDNAFQKIGSALGEAADAVKESSKNPEQLAEAIEEFRIRWMGDKNGFIVLGPNSWLRLAPGPLKRFIGPRLTHLKYQADEALSSLRRFQKSWAILNASPATHAKYSKSLDVTLPGIARKIGAEHPLTRTMREVVAVFQALGYSVALGPEVESDFYNFEALNFPQNHPARDTQDTLVIAGQQGRPARERLLMRTHTSPVQIRTMLAQAPPLRIVVPGKVHRNDESDATHSPIFHQVEGLCVDTNITFSDLKGTLDHAMKALFGSAVKTRFFPSFFPFTEPSADVQISCIFCGGKGCRKCKHSGWIELLGCGMVDPAVFAAVDARRMEMGMDPAYDTEKISGFAFGMGVDRIAMMLSGASDIGLFYSGDLRFLEQFA